MKRGSKKAISQILAGTMLATSVLTNPISIFAEDVEVTDEVGVQSTFTDEVLTTSSALGINLLNGVLNEEAISLFSVLNGPADSNEKAVFADVTGDISKVGDTFTVDYKVQNNPGINNYTFFIDYDPAVIKLEGANDENVEIGYEFEGTPFKLIGSDLIDQQLSVVPTATDTDYSSKGADGVKTAAELGRVKLAGVAGLSNQTSTEATGDGVLMSLSFKVVGQGSTDITIKPVGKQAFYKTPQSGTATEGCGFKLYSTPITVVSNVNLSDFTYTTDDVAISITNGVPAVTGKSVSSFAQTENAVNVKLVSDTTVKVAELVADIKAQAEAADFTATTTESGVTITDSTSNSLTFNFEIMASEQQEYVVNVNGEEIKVNVNGEEVTVAPKKGKAVKYDGGFYVPVVESSIINITDITVAGGVGANVSYSAATQIATLTYGDNNTLELSLFNYGDFDLSGITNVQDITAMLGYLNASDKSAYTEKQLVAGDVKGVGAVNVQCCSAVLNKLNDKSYEYDVLK